MKRRRRSPGEITVTLYDSEDREVEVTATYAAGTDAYFDRSWGNYLPGDPEEIEVISAVAVDEGANVEEVLADTGRLEDEVREAASANSDPYDTREEARGER